QVLLRPAPGPEAGHIAPAVESARRWLDQQRAMGARLGGPYATMLPFAEPRDGELTRAQLVGNDAWAIAGDRAAARLFAAAGRAADAAAASEAESVYRADFAAALRRTGSPDLPPSWQGPGRDWGAFAAAWPCGAIAPDDPRALAFARRVWRASGGARLRVSAPPPTRARHRRAAPRASAPRG